MTLGVKLLATTLGVAGGGGVIAPLTLWQTGYIGGSGSTTTTSSSHSSSSITPLVLPGICEVKGKEEWRDVLEGLSITTDSNYTLISCENTGPVLKEWTGIFPNEAFNHKKFQVSEKLDMKTNTKSVSDVPQGSYRTTFSSRGLSHLTLEGEWGTEEEKSVNKEGSKIYKVKVGSVEHNDASNSLYLVLSEQKVH